MNGLLGTSIDDPRTVGLLQLAASLSSNRNVVSGLANGLLGRQQIIAQAADADAKGRMRTLELERAQREAAREQALQAAAQQSVISPAQQALAGGGGPTMVNAQKLTQTPGGFDWSGYSNRLSGIDPMLALQVEAATRKAAPTPIKVGAGETLFDPTTGKSIFTNEKAESLPTDYRLYQLSGAEGRGMSFDQWDQARRRAGAANTTVSYGAPVAGVDARGNPVFFQPSKDGSAPAIVPGVAPARQEKQLTEGQAKSAAFASQMNAAEKELAGVRNFDLTSPTRQAEVALSGGLGNFAVGSDAQRVRQAQEQWSEAYLRFKTGAAATTDEVRSNVRTFFPQPGDKPEVVAQKARSRALAAKDVELGAGNAVIPTLDAPASSPRTNPLGVDPLAIEAELRRRQGR